MGDTIFPEVTPSTLGRDTAFDPKLKDENKKKYVRDDSKLACAESAYADLAYRTSAFTRRPRATTFRTPRLAILALQHGFNRALSWPDESRWTLLSAEVETSLTAN